MEDETRGARRAFWVVSFLYAIPISFVATLMSTVVFMQLAVAISDGTSPDDYLSAFFSSIFIALLVYVGFCYVIIPVTTLIVGAVRFRRRSPTAGNRGHGQTESEVGPPWT